MSSSLVVSVVIGAAVTVAVYIVLQATVNHDRRLPSRVTGLFSGLIGFIVAIRLKDDPQVLTEFTGEIAVAGLAVLVALLAALRRRV